MHKRRLKSERGQMLALVALLLPILLGVVGLFFDYGIAAATRRGIQNAAAAAAVAAVYELPGTATALSVAHEYAAANGATNGVDGVIVTVVTPYNGDSEKVEVTITKTVPTIFMHVLGITDGEVSARAVAQSTTGSGGGAGYAFLSLNPTACRAFDKSGSSNLIINNGGAIMVNSSCDNTSNGAINRTGSGDVNAGAINYYVDGNVTESGSGQLIPNPSPVGSPLPDPLTGLPAPDLVAIGISPDSAGTPADPRVLNVGGSPTILRPGVYYGGMKIASGGAAFFEPGTYVMAGGGLAITGSGAVTGDGVFIYNTNDPFAPQGGPGNPARCQEVNLRGSGGVILSPPTSGPYQDILFWQDVTCTRSFGL